MVLFIGKIESTYISGIVQSLNSNYYCKYIYCHKSLSVKS